MANAYRKGDHFSKRARAEGYAARSVYKLDEIQDRFRILKQGGSVIDLGCFPGSWSRFILQKIGKKGKLVGVDLKEPAFGGAIWLQRSVFEVSNAELLELLGRRADAVVSDMAPATSGNRLSDHVLQIELARRALEVTVATLKPGGAFVVKVFDGEDANEFCADVKRHFKKTKRVRPKATRKQSREFFLVATDFKAIEPTPESAVV